jgi:hypothetical protein
MYVDQEAQGVGDILGLLFRNKKGLTLIIRHKIYPTPRQYLSKIPPLF